MEQYQYTCQYCGINYTPKRRKKQKYCTNSCRTRAYQLRNPKLGSTVLPVGLKPESVKIDKMSFAGVGNAAAGTLAVNALTSLFTSEENKPATKKDIKNLESKLVSRYYPIKNGQKNMLGKPPYFDVETSSIVYF
jgi:hypothetical protein